MIYVDTSVLVAVCAQVGAALCTFDRRLAGAAALVGVQTILL
jgi:predicted nucleic acid-binding protein